MPKKSITSLELSAIINELQFLVKGKVSQIYHQEKKELLFQLHAVGEGKVLLKIVPGKFLCLTDKKEVPLHPSGFCMQLRKYLDNAFIKALYQKDAERIVVFELEKEEKFYLIIELFSKGNLIFTDENYKIIGVLERQIWKDRVVKPHELYIFPAVGVNWKTINEQGLREVFQKSNKKNLATSLATEIGLGGLYAEEICKKNNIDKDKLPKKVTDEEIEEIAITIKEFIELSKKPSGNVYEEEITPFSLLDKKPIEIRKTYNEAINILNPFLIVSPYEKKINTLEGRVKQQEEAIEMLKKKIELNTKKGETIYENYVPIQKLLDIVKEMKKTKEWGEIAEGLKKERNIKGINLKDKKVVIELEKS